ncbi:hypothetical protein LRP88_12412 [Fusarium phalaenopsidis]|nr:hypothetical protein NCS56_00640800 [Fusarium sp. Ph1]
MKYTLLTVAALATVAIAAPTPEKALSLGDLGLGGGDNKATVNGDTLTLVLNLQPLLDALLGSGKNVEVPTNSKAKAKRGHDQGAQLVKTLQGLLGDIQGHTNTIDNILLRIRTGGINRADGTKQCLDLLPTITGLLDGVVNSLTGFPSLGGGDYDDEVLDILDPLVSGLSKTVSNVARTLGVGGGQVGSGSLTPVTSSLSNLLECLLDIDPSLGTGLQGILNSVLGGIGTGTGTGTGTDTGTGTGTGAGTGTGLLGGLLGDVLTPVRGLLRSLNLNVGVKVGGKGSIGADDSDDSSDEEEEEEESSGGSGSSGSGNGSGNGSPVYNVPT